MQAPRKSTAFTSLAVNSRMLQYAIVLGIVFVSICIRLYNFPGDIEFKSDQASDLLIAQSIVKEGHRPFVGPFLSVYEFHMPPTYYYILAAMYALGHSPEGVVLILIAVHAVTLLLIYSIARHFGDFLYGIIVLVLYVISFNTDIQSRAIWQPNVLTVFILAYLYVLLLAYRKKNEWLLCVSVFFYSVGLTIYPSPALLMPHVLVSAYVFFYRVKKYSIFYAGFLTCLCISTSVLALSYRYFAYQWLLGFPILRSLQTDGFAFVVSADRIFRQYGMNFIHIFEEMFHFWIITPKWQALLHFASIPVYMYWHRTVVKLAGQTGDSSGVSYRQIFRFLRPAALLLGFACVFILDIQAESHRVWVFLPFALLLFGLYIRHAIQHPSQLFRYTILIYSFFYVASNSALVQSRLASDSNSDVRVLKEQGRYMHDTSVSREIPLRDIQIVSYIPGDTDNYNIFPYLYELHTRYGYPVIFVDAGNDVDRQQMNNPTKAYVFLACTYYPRYEAVQQDCLGYFLKHHPEYTLLSQKLFERNMMIFVLRKIPD